MAYYMMSRLRSALVVIALVGLVGCESPAGEKETSTPQPRARVGAGVGAGVGFATGGFSAPQVSPVIRDDEANEPSKTPQSSDTTQTAAGEAESPMPSCCAPGKAK